MSDSVRPHRWKPTRLPHPWDSPGKNTAVGCHFLLQCMKVKSERKSLSRVRLLATPWTVAHQAPLSLGFPRQEYWSWLPCPPPGDSSLPRDRTHVSYFSCMAGRLCTAEPPGKPQNKANVRLHFFLWANWYFPNFDNKYATLADRKTWHWCTQKAESLPCSPETIITLLIGYTK